MSETLASARAHMKIAVGNRTDIDTVLNDHYNDAVQELCTMYSVKELEKSATTPTVADEWVYLLPADYYGVIGVYDETHDREIIQDPKWTFETRSESETGESGPRNYAIYNRRLYLFNPIPSVDTITIRIDYSARHAELVLDADAIDLPLDWERGLRLKALAFTFDTLDILDRAAAKHAEFDQWYTRKFTSKAREDQNARDSRIIWTRG